MVKYRAGFEACVDCLLATGARFATATNSRDLDELHRQLGVKAARPLFAAARTARRSDATPDGRADRIRARFSARSERAAAGGAVPDLSNVYVLELTSPAGLDTAALRYASAAEVEWAHPDYPYSLNFVPDDPFYASSGSWGQSYDDLWGLHVTDAATAWDTSSGNGIVIGVVDSGIDPNHPDVAGNLWTNAGEIPGNDVDDDSNGFVDDVAGWDFVSGDNTPEDVYGHGTHVAGTAGAAGDNGVGVVGMAWQSRLMPVRVFGSGSAPVSVVAEGIVYAAENGADVINASFSGPATQVMADAIQTARGLGVIVVAAAGNDASNAATYEPAALPGVIAVSASDSNDNPAFFTNFGDPVSVAAPGVDVLSLQASGTSLGPVVTTGYSRLSGTSMATPHVAGLVAVLLGAQSGLNEDEVRWHLELNADQPGVSGWETDPWNPYLGYGRIDAGRVFDPPPATARLRPLRVERHLHSGGSNTLTDLTLSFTTHNPISWSLSTSSWIVPVVPSGVGPATVPLTIDGAGLTGGETFSGTVTADAPGTAWSETLNATAYVHRDIRDGAEIPVQESSLTFSVSSIRAASNGDQVLVVWNRQTGSITRRLMAALVDAQGAVNGPFEITIAPSPIRFAVASNGQDFLVVWLENADDIYNQKTQRRVLATRVLADGTVTPDPANEDPIVLDARDYRPYHLVYFPIIAFDGSDYVVAWQRRDVYTPNGRPYRTWVYFRRVAADGSPWPKRKKLALKGSSSDRPISNVQVACLTGSCLFTWEQDFTHYFVPLVGERLDYRNRHEIGYLYYFGADAFVAGSDGYLVAGRTSESCIGAGFSCARTVRAFRVDSTGNPLDSDLIQLSQGTTSPTTLFRDPVAAAFDGSDYLVTFNLPTTLFVPTGSPVFLARLAPDGSVRDAEQEGALVTAADSAWLSTVAALNGEPFVAWVDNRNAPPSFGSVYAQRLAP